MNAMNQEDELLKQLFAEAEITSKSDITEQVMHRLDVNPEAFKYEPVIGKKAWIVIGSVFTLVMIYLVANSGGSSFQLPDFIQSIKGAFSNLKFNINIEYTQPSLPKIPSTILTALVALNVIGVYLIISYRWKNWLYK